LLFCLRWRIYTFFFFSFERKINKKEPNCCYCTIKPEQTSYFRVVKIFKFYWTHCVKFLLRKWTHSDNWWHYLCPICPIGGCYERALLYFMSILILYLTCNLFLFQFTHAWVVGKSPLIHKMTSSLQQESNLPELWLTRKRFVSVQRLSTWSSQVRNSRV